MIFTDQLSRSIELKEFPKKIISVVPSQTEFIWDLGLKDQLVGITKFCVHPNEMYSRIEKIGGTKTLNIELIKKLNPDIIIANKEENEQAQIEELSEYFPVWISDIKTLEDALNMILELGKVFNKIEKSQTICNSIRDEFLNNTIQSKKEIKTAYFIWKKPWMAAGKDTFINHLLQLCNFKNVFENKDNRYPIVTENE